MTPGEVYLAAYDAQIRGRITAAEAASGRADRDGPAIRKTWEMAGCPQCWRAT